MTSVKERKVFNNISKEAVHAKLVQIFGKNHVTDKQVDLYPYSFDMTENPPSMPDFVVIPENKEQLVELVQFCNEYVIHVEIGG